jgi:hypothetical protein
MNREKIQDLAEHCDFYVGNEHWDKSHEEQQRLWVGKLAELIIDECVRHFNEDYQRDFDTNWREDLSKSIKQHFGVEE